MKLHYFYKKIWTKVRQKLEYRNQIENKKMTPGIILTRDIITEHHSVTATWHNDSLTRDNLFIFKKNQKNKKKFKKSRN